MRTFIQFAAENREIPAGRLLDAWVEDDDNPMDEESHKSTSRVDTHSARQHARILVVALDSTVRYVRRKVFAREDPPFQSEKEAIQSLRVNADRAKQLELMIEQIADATCFDLADCWRWVLTGREPKSAISVTLHRGTKRLPDGRVMGATRVRIESAVPLLGDPEIRAATSIARQLWSTQRMKSWSNHDIRLLRAVLAAGGAPTGKGMKQSWREIARKAEIKTWRAAFDRWSRLQEKAEKLGIPLDPNQGIDWWPWVKAAIRGTTEHRKEKTR